MLTSKDLSRIVPFVPPGILEEFDFPEWKIPIIAPVDHKPPQDYMNCTEKYQSQVRLAADGSLRNFVCGQPPELVDYPQLTRAPADRRRWNFEFRWQNMGLTIHDVSLGLGPFARYS